MEEWDLLNADRELTGKTHIRGEKLAPGELHLVVHVCIFNEKGQLLIQKRQKIKKVTELLGSFCGGFCAKRRNKSPSC